MRTDEPARPLAAQTILDDEQRQITRVRREQAIHATMTTHGIQRHEARRLLDAEIAPDED